MLQINNIEVMYNNVVLVLKGISLDAKEGKITTVLGANGAGKTTTLKAISGMLRPERGDITRGNIEFDGQRIDTMAGFDIVKKGLVQVFEGRRVFVNLTGDENLIAGGHIEPSTAEMNVRKDLVYTYF
ncbi:MAG: ATP-binding cassette domain-containing protein, partial [Alphaproteobacteria bacterium]